MSNDEFWRIKILEKPKSLNDNVQSGDILNKGLIEIHHDSMVMLDLKVWKKWPHRITII